MIILFSISLLLSIIDRDRISLSCELVRAMALTNKPRGREQALFYALLYTNVMP